MRIAVDLDGVCYEFQRTYRYMLREYRGVEMPPVEESWVCWDAQEGYGNRTDHAWMWDQGVELGLFRYGHMVKGARRGIEALVADGHDIAIVTHRPARATPDTVDWLSLYMKGIPYTLHILSNGEPKTEVPWDVIIDDKPENIDDAIRHGRFAVLFQQPWNDGYFTPREATEAMSWADMEGAIPDAVRDQGQRRARRVRVGYGQRHSPREDLVASRYVGSDAAALGRATDEGCGEVHA